MSNEYTVPDFPKVILCLVIVLLAACPKYQETRKTIKELCAPQPGITLTSLRLEAAPTNFQSALPTTGEIPFNVESSITVEAGHENDVANICIALRDTDPTFDQNLAANMVIFLASNSPQYSENQFFLSCNSEGKVTARTGSNVRELQALNKSSNERSTRIYAQQFRRVADLTSRLITNPVESNRIRISCP